MLGPDFADVLILDPLRQLGQQRIAHEREAFVIDRTTSPLRHCPDWREARAVHRDISGQDTGHGLGALEYVRGIDRQRCAVRICLPRRSHAPSAMFQPLDFGLGRLKLFRLIGKRAFVIGDRRGKRLMIDAG